LGYTLKRLVDLQLWPERIITGQRTRIFGV